MAKSYEELEFTDNFMFVKIMSSRLDLCKELLELILQKKISRLEQVNYEHTYQPTYESKGIRLDVYVEDDVNSRYDVEMQVEPDKFIAKRSRYYHSAMDLEMLLKGKHYSDLNDSYVIFICKNDIPGDFKKPVNTFRNICIEDPGKNLNDGTCTVFVNADCKSSEISDEMRSFLEFIRTGRSPESEGSLAGKLNRAVEEAIHNRKWSVEYMWWQDELNDRFNLGCEAGRKVGLEEGRAKGLEEGRAKGLEEGRAKGLEEGRAKGLEEGRAEGLEEGRAEGLEEGRAEGFEQGRAEGFARAEAAEKRVAELEALLALKDKA